MTGQRHQIGVAESGRDANALAERRQSVVVVSREDLTERMGKQQLSEAAYLDAIRAGRTFATNGPMLTLTSYNFV